MKMKDSEPREPSVGFTLDRRSLLRSSALMGGALAVHALSADAAFTAAAGNSPVATTKAGVVRGKLEDGIDVFKGIPYGAPPTGPLRFMPPVPPAAWTGVRDALEFGDQCPQVPPPPTPEWRS
jgi:para-nitrobenzyl esterase